MRNTNNSSIVQPGYGMSTKLKKPSFKMIEARKEKETNKREEPNWLTAKWMEEESFCNNDNNNNEENKMGERMR